MKLVNRILFNNNWFAYVAIAFSAILYAISIQMFIQVAHTFTAGLSSIAILPTFLIEELSPYASLLYFALNIPLIILFWRKTKKDFIFKTLFFLITQSIFSFLFLIPEVSHVLKNLIADPSSALKLTWPIFILAIIGGFAIGASVAVTWRFGGSSGGSDIIAYYYSTKKKISTAFVSFLVSSFFVIISFVTTLIIDPSVRSRWLPILLGTLSYVFINSLMIQLIYPKYSKIIVEVHTKKWKSLSGKLKENNYIHSWQIKKVESGYTGESIYIISTVMLLLEFKPFVRKIKNYDDSAWLSSTRIRRTIGKFDTTNIE